MTPPAKILHIELSEGVPEVPLHPGYGQIYLVFWWHNLPLGHQEISATQLPLSATQLANLAVPAITPAVGDHLLAAGFKAPLSEHFARQAGAIPAWQELLTLENPLRKLTQRSLKPAPEPSGETVSVIICTRDRPEHLALCLQSLQKLADRPQEIIIVDNAPTTDKTRELVCGMPGICYIREPRPGLSVARNTGIRHSSGDIVAFTDDDVSVHPDWLTRLRQGFRQPEVMAVTGLILPAELETEAQLIFEVGLGNFGWGYQVKTFDQEFFQATKHVGVPVWRIGAGANMAFRRQIFERVGNFDERLGTGAAGCSEDSELWYRILAEGWTCRYEPTSVVFHYHRRDLAGLKRQMYYYMRGHVAALLVQFARYDHWGNLLRLLIVLPLYYAKVGLGGLRWGFRFRYKTCGIEVQGCLAGVKFFLQHRYTHQDFKSCLPSDPAVAKT